VFGRDKRTREEKVTDYVNENATEPMKTLRGWVNEDAPTAVPTGRWQGMAEGDILNDVALRRPGGIGIATRAMLDRVELQAQAEKKYQK
jgi:hypothetical protein